MTGNRAGKSGIHPGSQGAGRRTGMSACPAGKVEKTSLRRAKVVHRAASISRLASPRPWSPSISMMAVRCSGVMLPAFSTTACILAVWGQDLEGPADQGHGQEQVRVLAAQANAAPALPRNCQLLAR